MGPVTVNGRTVHWVQELRGTETQREAFYDENWNLLGETPEGVEALGADEGDILLRLPDGRYRWASREEPLDLPDYCRREDCFIYPIDGILQVTLGDIYGGYTLAILSREGEEIIGPEMYGEIYVLKGAALGQPHYLGIPPYGSGVTQCRVHDGEGKVLFTFENDRELRQIWYSRWNIITTLGRETLVYSPEGELLLQYTLFETEG